MHAEFYKLVAQIIPVLFLAISLQSGLAIARANYSENEKLYQLIHTTLFIIVATLLIVAEYVALNNIYTSQEAHFSHNLVLAALYTGALYVVADFINYINGRPKETFRIFFVILLITYTVFAINAAQQSKGQKLEVKTPRLEINKPKIKLEQK